MDTADYVAPAPSSVLCQPEYYERLTAELKRARGEIDVWCRQQMKALETLKQDHINELKKGEVEFNDFQKKEESLKKRLEEVKQLLEEEKKRVQDRRVEIDNFASEQQAKVDEQKSHLQEEISNIEKDAEKEREMTTKTEMEREAKVREFDRGVSFYRDRLGFRFEKTKENGLRFVFKYLDPSDYEREFVFSVAVTEANCYELRECHPMLSGVSSLIDGLNETNDFSKFVREIRKKFKATL